MHSDELGAALRTWRDRLQPDGGDFPSGSRRRAPGLRREELAVRAGLSVDYLTRLEQGRARHPTAQVVQALTDALRLNADEREHLFRLAGQAVPGPRRVPSRITPSVQRILDRFADVPVSVLDAAWTFVAWNPLWALLMGEPSGEDGRQRNLLWRRFTGAGGRLVRDEREAAAFDAAAVADLRSTAARYPRDEQLQALITDLCRVSERFAQLWDEQRVGVLHASRKTVAHPQIGTVTFDCDVLTTQGSDLRIIVYTAQPGTPDADALALLRLTAGAVVAG